MPAYDKVQKDQLVILSKNEKELNAVTRLQVKCIVPPVSVIISAEPRGRLETDPCDVQIGCIKLLEKPDKSAKAIGHWSRSLTSAERVYKKTKRECFFIVRAVLLLGPYPEGTQFLIRTNHNSLNSISDLSDASERLAWWHLIRSKFTLLTFIDPVWRTKCRTHCRNYKLMAEMRPIEMTSYAVRNVDTYW